MIYQLGSVCPSIEGEGHFIAESASVIGNVRLGSHSSIWFGCVLRGDNETISIGERSNIQDGSVLHTDLGFPLHVGDNVTVGHKVMLHGCRVHDYSLIGISSTILNGATIGPNCIVGANSLVTEGKSFPEGSLIIGAPARVARPLTDEEIASLPEMADIYVNNAERFKRELKRL